MSSRGLRRVWGRRPARGWTGWLALAWLLVAVAAPAQGPPEPQELVPFEIIDFAIPEPLAEVPGDPVRGLAIVIDATNATCLICHTMPIPDQPDQGNLAPDLAGVGSRYTGAELRLRLVNAKFLNPDTIMPAYYWLEGLVRVQEQYAGQTVYGPQDIEDVIAYLLTLTGE